MPVMDGYESSLRINKMIKKNNMRQIPIVAVSANSSDEDRKRCLANGIKEHI